MRQIYAIVFVALFGLSVNVFAQEQGTKQPSSSRFGFIFLPFDDKSDFEGKWNPGFDVPRFLSVYVKEKYRIPCISPVIVRNFLEERRLLARSKDDVKFWMELYKFFHLRYLVVGVVEQFDVSRFTTGQPLVGGYEAFKGEVKVNYFIYDLDRTSSSASPFWIKKGESVGEHADRSLAFTLFGKPSDRTVEFRDLDKIRFGSEDFNRTVIGQAHFQLGENFSLELENTLPSIKLWAATTPDSLLAYAQGLDSISLAFEPRLLVGSVVFREEHTVFINLGSDDGVRVGARVNVYTTDQAKENPADRIGELQIDEVRGPHLSSAQIISGQKEIKAKDKVFVTVVK